MLVQAIPIFQDAHLLRRDMLEALSDYAYLSNQLLYKGYGDGIMAGCELTTTKDSIILNEGVIFYEGQMFLIKEPMCIHYQPTNVTTVLKIHFSDQLRDAGFIYREVEVSLSEGTALQKGEIELCRFKLQSGAKLRYHYQGFEDRNTEFDTLNVIHAAYSAKGGSTLAPELLWDFAKEMLGIEGLSDFDALFCIQLMNQKGATVKDALTSYLQRRNKTALTDISNLSIYGELVNILGEAKNGVKGGSAPVKKKWKLTVD